MGKKHYTKTKHPNIWCYETANGTRYRIRKAYRQNGKKKEFDESGKKTLASAKARLREIENYIEQHELGYLNSHLTTVEEYYNTYSKRKLAQKVWSKDTKKGIDSLFKLHIFPVFGSTPLSKIDRNKYELHLVDLLKTRRKRTIQSIHVAFNAMLNDAVYTGSLERNRLTRVHIGESKIPPKNKRISLQEYQLWIKTAEKILPKYIFSMVYMTTFGLRRGEVNGIRKGDISFSNKTGRALLHIQETRTNSEPLGKGGTKNKTSNRFIELDTKGTELINFALNEATEIRRDYQQILHNEDFIFINESYNCPFNVSQINRYFQLVSKETNIKVTPHIMRHNFATQAMIAGVPAEYTASYLGHKNTTMTEHYTHIKDETAPKVIDIMEARLSTN